MKPVILASSSPRRKQLLEQIKLPFTVVPSNVHENIKAFHCSPFEAAEQLSLLKAEDVAKRFQNDTVIGADTIVVIDDDILGKPRDENEACEMLTRLSGRQHEVITGVSLINIERNIEIVEHESTKVRFRKLTPLMIESYVKSGEPMDKAGAYAIQGLGALFAERIEGCYFNVVGLPLARLGIMLEKAHINSEMLKQ